MIKLCKITIVLIISSINLFGQTFSGLRSKPIIGADSIKLDTLSIVPGSEIILHKNTKLNTTHYKINYTESFITLFNQNLSNDTLWISYRVFPFNFSKPIPEIRFNPQVASEQTLSNKILPGYTLLDSPENNERIKINGSISRGVGAGNSQNLVVNSDMNLQMHGLLANDLKIDALLSDNNIPIQPDGYTQKIQEFDQVYIRIYDSIRNLQMGDIEIKNGQHHFLKFNRKIQGLQFENKTQNLSESISFNMRSSAAIAKGNFNRQQFIGIEGVQGPYKLYGANNERFIIVLAGSEKIYLDGLLLKRGESADYIMNYNTAELTFSPNIMITKDSRIVAEFEYSDQNYNRFILHTTNQIHTKNSSYSFEVFSEADAKNQPINIDLSQKNQSILQNAGDDPLKAITSSIDSANFENNLVLYKMIDTVINNIVYDSVLVQSFNADSAFYTASFSLVGNNNGNYIQINTVANGKVFQWVAPQNNIPQGNYEPVQVLIAPKKQQVFTAKASYRLPAKTHFDVELAYSNKDVNTHSTLDANDNKGYAFKSLLKKETQIANSSMVTSLNYEWVTKNFNPIERYKNTEFNRDWNLTSPIGSDEHFLQLQLLWHKSKQTLHLNQEILKYKTGYKGIRTNLGAKFHFAGFALNGKFSFLESENNLENSNFYRHNIALTKNISVLKTGILHDLENNQLRLNSNDSLLSNSTSYSLLKVFLQTQDTLKRSAGVSYNYRQDFLPSLNQLHLATLSHDAVFEAKLAKSRFNQLQSKIIYRELKLENESLIKNTKADQNLLGSVDHKLSFKKRFLSLTTYYEIGTGMETKKEFSYLEVAAGQGSYEWIDYNQNEIPELNEFEVSLNPESANYIKIYTPTDEYIKVYGLKLNESLRLDPLLLWRNEKGMKKFLSRFSNVFSYQLHQKQSNDNLLIRINPFSNNLPDSALITIAESLRNTFSFNRTGTVFATDYIYSSTKRKNLLTHGFDENMTIKHELKTRWNITTEITFLNMLSKSTRQYESEFFTTKNYRIHSKNNQASAQWQPSTKFRIAIFYNYKNKQNTWGNEKVLFQELGPELKFNAPKQGILTFKSSIVLNNFRGETNSSVAYLLLEGLQPGENYRWSVNISRNINNYLRLNFNYNGRKPAELKTIHTGQVSLSAYF